jgi:hypothetical protein
MKWQSAIATSLAAIVVGCGGAASAGPKPPAEKEGRLGSVLTVAPGAIARACRKAGSLGLAVLCPADWPPMRSRRSPALRWITLNPRVYLLNAFNGLDDRTPHVFHLLLGGQQRPFAPDWKAIDPGLRITTRLIRIPIRGSGSGSGSGAFVQQRPARRIGTTVIHGRGALLLAEPDYPHGGSRAATCSCSGIRTVTATLRRSTGPTA